VTEKADASRGEARCWRESVRSRKTDLNFPRFAGALSRRKSDVEMDLSVMVSQNGQSG
jgi:hypothetical protein